VLENNEKYVATTLGEPQMGKRGLYNHISHTGRKGLSKLLIDFLVYADGKNDLIDIANIIGESAYKLIEIKNILKNYKLIKVL